MKKEVRPKDSKSSFSKFSSEGEVSLWLDDYNDLFSDFDPRPFSHKALSQDFLDELRRATSEANKGFKLKLLVSADLRKTDEETVIKRRLKEHFAKHAQQLLQARKKIVLKGIILTIIGFALMVGAAYLYHRDGGSWLVSFLTVLFEPAGWFMVWYGLDQIFYTDKNKRPEHQFYEKMDHADIKFVSY